MREGFTNNNNKMSSGPVHKWVKGKHFYSLNQVRNLPTGFCIFTVLCALLRQSDCRGCNSVEIFLWHSKTLFWKWCKKRQKFEVSFLYFKYVFLCQEVFPFWQHKIPWVALISLFWVCPHLLFFFFRFSSLPSEMKYEIFLFVWTPFLTNLWCEEWLTPQSFKRVTNEVTLILLYI